MTSERYPECDRYCEHLAQATELAYRKHTLDDTSVGWTELSDILVDALCDHYGAQCYCLWVEQFEGGEKSLRRFSKNFKEVDEKISKKLDEFQEDLSNRLEELEGIKE